MVETQNTFVDAAKAAGVQHVIKFSGLAAAQPETAFIFGRMHREIEEYLEKSGLAWTHLRPTGFMQEYLREAPSVIHQGALFFALGDVRLNPVDLVDVAKVGFRLLRDGGHEGARLSVTGPEALTMAQVPIAFHARQEGRCTTWRCPGTDRQQALLSHGIPAEYVEALDKQVEERLQAGSSRGWIFRPTGCFDVQPTTFLEFAERNADAFGGRVREGALA